MSFNRPVSRARSVSEPSLQVLSGDFTRGRLRKTDLEYERGKDKLAHWMGTWGHQEVCALLQYLVARCPLNQMEYLWTVMESVPHRDFLYSAANAVTIAAADHSGHLHRNELDMGFFRPLSTPISRQITAQVKKSRRVENKRLYRANSLTTRESFRYAQKHVLDDLHLFEAGMGQTESQLLALRSIPEGAAVSKLPIGHVGPGQKPIPATPIPHCFCSPFGPSKSPALPGRKSPANKSRLSHISSPVSTRILTPMRRHMTPVQRSYSSPHVPSYPKKSQPSSKKKMGSHFVTKQPTLTGQCDPTDQKIKPSAPGQVTIVECEPVSDAELSRPGTRMESRLVTRSREGIPDRPATALEMRPATTETPAWPATGLETRPTTGMETRSTTGLETRPTTRLTFLSEENPKLLVTLSPELRELLQWFSDLRDWQQQEILQMVVWNLDRKELYFLSTLIASRQYRDFITQLPEPLAVRVFSYISAKFILRNCTTVSWGWYYRCSTDNLWELKAKQVQLGLQMRVYPTMKQLYMDDLRLKKNWMQGRTKTSELEGHKKRVVCVQLKGTLLASGSSDRTLRLWNLTTMKCEAVYEHSDTVWSLNFYGNHFLISGAGNGLIKIWNYRTGTCDRILSWHKKTVWSICLKKEVLVSGGQDKLVRTCLLSFLPSLHVAVKLRPQKAAVVHS